MNACFKIFPLLAILLLYAQFGYARQDLIDIHDDMECSSDSVVRKCQEWAAAASEVSRPVTQIYMLEVGGTSDLDTYLSPLRYNGYGTALAGQWSKALPWMNNRWIMRFGSRIGFSSALNPAATARMLGLDLALTWGPAFTWKLPMRLHLTAGADIGLSAGVLYLPRNSNNPASAKADVGIALTASASWPFQIGKLNILLSDEIGLPSLSAFFSPEYGEPYYEIYLGNHSGLVHCGWWGNHFGIDNLLAFDLDIGPSALRIGYRYSLRSSWINHLDTQIQTHSFVIGWIPHGIGLRPTAPRRKSIIVSSLY